MKFTPLFRDFYCIRLIQFVAGCLFIGILLATSGCASYRGMPSHGGGKRFDEEQRILAAAIRHAIQQMDLSEVEPTQISMEISSLETSGTGQPNYPGLGNLNFNAGYADTDIELVRRAIGSASNNFDSDDGNFRQDARVSANFQMNPSLRTNNNITREDMQYLKRVLEMHFRHEGFQIVAPAQAKLQVIVLVDVLGTNLSRLDYGLAYRDDLGATCELSYYFINPKNQVVEKAIQSSGSVGRYLETNFRLTPIRKSSRELEKIEGFLTPSRESTVVVENLGALAEVAASSKSNLEILLDTLYQKAVIAIEANNRTDALKAVEAIRLLDPDYSNLPELEQSIAEL